MEANENGQIFINLPRGCTGLGLVYPLLKLLGFVTEHPFNREPQPVPAF